MLQQNQLHSLVEELKNNSAKIAHLKQTKHLRGILKCVGVGFFLYRDIDDRLAENEEKKNSLLMNVYPVTNAVTGSIKEEISAIEKAHRFLSPNEQGSWSAFLDICEADLIYLNSYGKMEPAYNLATLSQVKQARQYILGFNANLEKAQLKNRMLELKDTILQAEEEYVLLNHRPQYFSKRELYDWREKYSNLASLIRESTRKGVIGLSFQNSLSTIINVYDNGERLLKQRNQEYVEAEIQKVQQFENIEGRTLSEEQKRAIVVDEANNLIVAGAGTGKTTALLGKAFYIVSKGLAKPEEVLIIAFNTSIVEENREKVNHKKGIKFPVRTYHSLGYEIIGQVQGERPSVPLWAKDKLATQSFVLGIIKDLMKDKDFAQLINSYFLFFFHTFRSIFEFKSLGEYYQYLKENEVRTLKGHRVRSLEECEIANFLYMNGIDYEYEKPFEEEKPSTPERRRYEPDFTLPKYGLYIEHFGIDRNRNTAHWVPRDKYLADMQEKIELHKRIHNLSRLVQTFSYQRQEGNLLENLESELLKHGVELNPMPPEQIFEKLNEMGKVNLLASLLSTFINLYKSNNENLKTVRSRAKPEDARATSFLKIFGLVYNEYMRLLEENDNIDFNDMINRATELVEQKKWISPFRYILVDEFQDISQSRKRFLRALLNQNKATLYCVGDDWQSVYRFAGGDLSVMTNFEKNFGLSETRIVQETHRFNKELCEFSTRFILANPQQIRKEVRSKTAENKPAVTVVKERTEIALENIIREISQTSAGKPQVLIINRYKNIGRPRNLGQLQKGNPKVKLEYTTAHSAKGRTVDFAIVIGLKRGIHGFPCQIEGDPLLNMVQPSKEQFPFAEERRLFYVAITRARKHVYLVIDDPFNVSEFITEIENNGYKINTIFKKVKATNCPICKTGFVVWKEKSVIRGNDEFTGWGECSNNPYCDYRPSTCPKCGSGFLSKEGQLFRCSNEKCLYQVKACPECEDGHLVPRKDRYGQDFFGCSNFAVTGCRHTEESMS
jgi:DNA helicase-4